MNDTRKLNIRKLLKLNAHRPSFKTQSIGNLDKPG